MALNIRNPETDQLAEQLAELTGETKTAAVTQALRERLQRVRRERSGSRLADRLDAIALRTAALPVQDERSADEILGYDTHSTSAIALPTPSRSGEMNRCCSRGRTSR
jgi:antitoxin VapB